MLLLYRDYKIAMQLQDKDSVLNYLQLIRFCKASMDTAIQLSYTCVLSFILVYVLLCIVAVSNQ